MTAYEYERLVGWVKIFCIIVGVFTIITSITTNILGAIIYIALLYVFYRLTKKRSVVGPIIGIVLGVIYICEFKLLSIIIGVLLILACAAMYKFILDVSKTKKM